MLGKLLKHEIRHSARYNFIILIATVAVTAIVGLSLLSDSVLLAVFACLALGVTGVATVIVTLVSVIKNFYDTIYGRQGYLTLTLPVKGSQVLFSKVLISFMWVIVGFLAMAVPYVLIFLYAKVKVSTLTDMFESLLSSILNMLPEPKIIISGLIMVVVLAIATVLTYVGYIYFSVTIANTRAFQNHPVLFGGLTFFGLSLVVSQVGNLIGNVIPLHFVVTLEKAYISFQPVEEILGGLPFPIGGTLFKGVVALGLLFATGYIIENKVNIK